MNLAESENSGHLFLVLQTVDEFAVVTARVVSRVRAYDLAALHLSDDTMLLLQQCAE